MRLPARVRLRNGGIQQFMTETQNVSARGVYLYLDSDLEVGNRIEFTLTFPPELTFTRSIRVRFSGRAVRVERGLPGGKYGVAAAIDDYEFLTDPEEQTARA
jgi:hypothetical protein